MRAGIQRLQRPVARCRQITGDTAHAKAIGAVRGDRNLDNRVVKTGDGGKTGADRRVGRHLDDAVMFVRDHHLAFRTQHAVGVLATDIPGLQHQINPRHIGAGRRKHALHAGACIGRAADHLQHLSSITDLAHPQLVCIGMLFRCFNTPDHNTAKLFGGSLYAVDFQTGHGQLLQQCVSF